MTASQNTYGPAGDGEIDREEPSGEADEPATDTREEGSTSGQPPDAVDELTEALDALSEHRDRVRDLEQQLLRRAAEFQNYRRRTQEDLSLAGDRARAEVATRMIDVLDDLRRSRDAAEEAASREGGGPMFESLKDGVDLVYRKFEDALASFGVRPMDVVGEPFDEELHEALMQADSDEHAPGTVVSEIQKGYTMGDRVLRHAGVVVAR